MEHYRYLFEKVLGRSLNIYGLNILKTDYRISVRLVAYAVVASFYCIGNVATCFLNTYIEALKAMSTESAWLMVRKESITHSIEIRIFHQILRPTIYLIVRL